MLYIERYTLDPQLLAMKVQKSHNHYTISIKQDGFDSWKSPLEAQVGGNENIAQSSLGEPAVVRKVPEEAKSTADRPRLTVRLPHMNLIQKSIGPDVLTNCKHIYTDRQTPSNANEPKGPNRHQNLENRGSREPDVSDSEEGEDESEECDSSKSIVQNPPNKNSKRTINFDGVPASKYRIYKVQKTKKGWIKRFQCLFDNCKMEFTKSCHLRNHFRKHTGYKPF